MSLHTYILNPPQKWLEALKRFEALEIGPDLASSQNWANPDLTSSRFYRLAITKDPIHKMYTYE